MTNILGTKNKKSSKLNQKDIIKLSGKKIRT